MQSVTDSKYDLTDDTSYTMSTTANYPLDTAAAITVVTPTYVPSPTDTYPLDILYVKATQTLTGYLENIFTQASVSTSCSISGSSVITYSIQQYQSNPLPSWVTWDSATSKINVLPPSVTSNQIYYFSVVATVASPAATIATPVSLQILN